MQPERRVERLLRGAVPHELDAAKQASPPDVADVGMLAEGLAQQPLETLADAAHPCEEIVGDDRPLDRQRPGAGRSVAEIGVAVQEEAGPGTTVS